MATRTPSLQNDNIVAINREIGSQYDNVKLVADNIDDVVIVAGATATTQIVADNISNVTSVANAVVPNIAEILLADNNAATATAMATTATTQAGLANTARVAAEVAQGIAENEADAAALSAVAADTSADLAAVSAGTASTKAGEAAASAIAAHNSELAAAAILDAFDDRYLGAFAANPAVDNDGNALQSGAIYYNTVAHNLRVYDSSLVDWISLSAVTFAGMQDVALTSPATGDVLKWNGTDWINTKEVALNSVQLLGGAGTQGTMTWNADEETVDIVQNGAVLQVGQEIQTHVRNNTASTINNGTVVMATGTIGASGRITVAPYNNVADVKYVIGVVTENIAAGDDGKVTHFGKVRGINTSAWNEGDVLYTAAAGGLTNVVPTSGKKLAVAFVVTKHAVNGTIMVRVSGVDELVYEPKNANIQSHIASTSNPHSVTKAQVGLGSVDNTSDATKNVLSATKLTTTRAIQLSGAVTGTADFDGSAAINIVTTHTADPVITLAGDATGSVTLTNMGSGTLTVTVVDDSHNHVVDNVDGLRTELDAKAPLASPALTGTPTAPTAAVGDSSIKLATTAFVNAEIANDTYLKGTLDTSTTIMSKAAFNALAAERRANRAGSGFDEMGKVAPTTSTQVPVQDGMWTISTSPNVLYMGRNSAYADGVGASKTYNPYACINGILHNVNYVNIANGQNQILLPTAPTVLPYDAVLTTEQIAMGVIKHADASNSGLIVNGKFDTDTSGWTTAGTGTTIIQSSGQAVVTVTTAGYGAKQTISTIIGKKYILECNFISTSGSGRIYASNLAGTALSALITTIGRGQVEFTATETATNIWVANATIGSTTFDNIAVFPADAISRSDLVFLESWHEDVSEKDFVYPLGNVQYLGGVTDGMGAIVSGAFSGSDTYSLFGNWQASGVLVGKGYVWSTMTDVQKKAFVSNPENNCYLDGDKVIQVRYRMRVVAGIGDSWGNVNTEYPNTGPIYGALCYKDYDELIVQPKGKDTSTVDIINGVANSMGYLPTYIDGVLGAFKSYKVSVAYEGKCYALPIALVHRRNQGAYHPVYNPNGANKLTDAGNTGGRFWHESSAIQGTTLNQMFTKYNVGGVLSTSERGSIASAQSGRPDGLFYDQVHEGDIIDLRMSSQKVEDYNRLIDREFNKLVAGTYRGSEGEWEMDRQYQPSGGGGYNSILTTNQSLYKVGDIVVMYQESNGFVYKGVVTASSSGAISLLGLSYTRTAGGYILLSKPTTRTKSNTLTHTDIIGSPTNYPIAWKQSGVSGVPLIVAEDGTSMLPTGALTVFKLSRKANAAPLQVLKSTDSGATWTLQAVTTNYTFSTTTNAITFVVAPAATDLIMVTYQTHTNMAVPGVNSEVLCIGNVIGTNHVTYGQLNQTLLNKVSIGSTAPVSVWGVPVNGYRIDMATMKFGSTAEVPSHGSITLGAGEVAVKTFPYLTRSNGKARLQLVFKEMKYSSANADWGDDTKFDIVDNVSTTTDFYGNTVLVGQKYAELPYFIEAKE